MREVLIEKISKPDELLFEDEGRTFVWYDKKHEIKRTRHYFVNGVYRDTFFKNGLLHRNGDEPAIFDSDGSYEAYYKNGKLHRGIFEPAEIYGNGRKRYYVYGELRFEIPVRNTYQERFRYKMM